MFLNIAMQLHNIFYKLVALGLGTCYIFQAFLTIGGVSKFIPSTGVTIPLVSYGGSSLLSTIIMFAIIQGLYILREDEEEDIERKKEGAATSKEKQTERIRREGKTGNVPRKSKKKPVKKTSAANRQSAPGTKSSLGLLIFLWHFSLE